MDGEQNGKSWKNHSKNWTTVWPERKQEGGDQKQHIQKMIWWRFDVYDDDDDDDDDDGGGGGGGDGGGGDCGDD